MALSMRHGLCAGLAAAMAALLIGAIPAAADPGPPHVEVSLENALCMECHDRKQTTEINPWEEREVDALQLTLFSSSAHGEVTCLECHPGLSRLPHRDEERPTRATVAGPVTCSECHKEAYDGFMRGHHGTMIKLADTRGPECADCHGDVHYLKPVEQWTAKQRVEACAECHSGANSSFLDAAPGHAEASMGFLSTSYFAGLFLMVLTILTLAFGIIHVELEMLRWLVRRITGGRRARTADDGHTG